MHDCRKTKELFTELLLDQPDRGPDERLTAELHGCEECRAEFTAVKATLRATTRFREAAVPAESYWTGYYARLRDNLAKDDRTSDDRAGRPSWLIRLLKSSVPVPVPVAAALIIAGAILIPLVIKASRRQVVEPPSPVVIRVPVEVPKIQEKIVTQVVYRERRSSSPNTIRANNNPRVNDAFARSQKPATEIPATLTGFKPTDEIKLTVIKGGTPNEK